VTAVHARVGAVMIDCHDPETLFGFWSQITGIEMEHKYPDFIFGTKLPDSDIRLAFQRVPEEKVVKNRLHLDLSHEDPEAVITKIIDLGGSRLQDHEIEGFHWTVMADPEGNEFCITADH
jgi:predicted enzyme related to lactoylglutathione lyase